MKKYAVIVMVMLVLVFGLSACREKIPSSISDIPESKHDPNVFYLANGLYDIGQYKSDEKYEHFKGEPVYEFVPSADYGLLLPFSGGSKHYEAQDGYVMGGFDMSYSKYGLCTIDGRVVVEPVYAYINGFTSEDGFTYYDLSYDNEVELDENGNILNQDDVFIANRRVIIPEDGSWSLELENGSYVGGANDGIILVCKNDYQNNKNEYRFYDYDGNFLFSLDSYDHVGAYSCGYAMARIYPEYSHDTKDSPQIGECVYIDKRGNVALEGYTDGTVFNKSGVASVQLDGEKYALINTDGEYLTETIYDNLYSTGSDGYFQGFIAEENTRHIFNNRGEHIGTVLDNGTSYVSVETLAGGEIVYSYYDPRYDSEQWYRLSDNSPIICKENGKMPNDYSHGDNLFIYKEVKDGNGYNEETKAILFDIDGETIAKLDRYRYASWIDNEAQLMGYVRNNHDAKPMTDEEEKLYGTQNKDEFVILNTQTGEEICVFKNCYYAVLLGNENQLAAVQVSVRGEYGEEIEYYIYDIASKSVVRGLENLDEYKITAVGGKEYLTVGKQDSITLYDEVFNIVLRKYLDTNV